MADLVTFGETMLRLNAPRGTPLHRTDSLDLHVGGAESNVAVAAAGLDLETVWMSKVPDSPLGRRVVNELRGAGVTPAVTWSEEGRQGVYFLEQGGAPRGSEVIYDRQAASITTATPDELPVSLVESSAMFHTSGITPALSNTLADTVIELIERAEAASFDLNYRRKLWPPQQAKPMYERLLDEIEILFAPVNDTKRVLGLNGAPDEIAAELRARFDIPVVVVTVGGDGAVGFDGAEAIQQPAFEAETVDPIGTGDAFVGGFLASYLRDGSLDEALVVGAATAALKRTVMGDAVQVTQREVARVIGEGEAALRR